MRPRTNYVRFYPSPYLVLTEQGYTKHYYAGADRVCARLGSGGLDHDSSCISRNEEVSTRVESLFWHGLKLVDAKEFKPEIIKELQLVDIHGKELDWLKNVDIEKLLLRLRISVKPDPWKIHHVIDDLVRERPDDEPEVYFYHSDHLGGASWITDHHGLPVQHLQYLPYGEPYVDQRTSGYSERFRFTGKERDEETGYGYFGARYMDHELMTMWLSVDPMADKYPSISPYAYCAWNPVKLVDPDGNDWYQNELTGCIYYNSKVKGADAAGTGAMKGEGWKYLGTNGMFSTDGFHNSDLDIVRRNNGKMNYNEWTKSFDMELSLDGDKAKSVMKSVGYKQVPTQVIQYDNTYEMRMPGSPEGKYIDFDCGSRIDYVEKVGYVPNSYKEINRSNIGETVYGKFDPILNNMPFANRQQIRYGEKSGFLGFLETLVQSILPAHHDLSSPQRISIKDYKKDNKLVNTILKRK